MDGLYDIYPDRLRPFLPCACRAFTLLTSWVERGSDRRLAGATRVPTPGTWSTPAASEPDGRAIARGAEGSPTAMHG